MRKTFAIFAVAMLLTGCANITAKATFTYPAPVVAK